jgi:hypothetical protein
MTLSNHRANGLDIRIEHALGFIVRVTDVVAGDRLFLTNLTDKRHGSTPSHRGISQLGGDTTTAY